MELNDLYDHFWNLGTLVQGERSTYPSPTFPNLQHLARQAERREQKRLNEEEAEKRKMQRKGAKFNKNMEEPLASTIGDLLAHLKAMDNAIGVSKHYLKRQINARIMRAELDEFSSIGDEYRAKNKKEKLN